VTLQKPYYDHDGITIYHGDCRDVLPHLSGVDLVLTDPIYNRKMDYGPDVNDDRPRGEYVEWLKSWFALLPCEKRIIFPGVGNLWLWGDMEPSAVACWYKPGNPARGGCFQFVEWEPILFWGLSMGKSDVFRFPVTNQTGVGNHPCPKPLSLFQELIGRTKAQVVLDPFLGSGTTALAAKNLYKRAIGIEINEQYCEIAVKRLAQEVLPFAI